MESVKNELVSVIIPTYNRAKLIRKSIYSVLAQSYKNIEVIVVDDGSEDNTRNVVNSIGDERIRYVALDTNMGAAHARNVGITNARGKYIAFQDSDDCWHPRKLEKQLEVLEAEQADIVFCRMTICGEVDVLYPDEDYFLLDEIENGMFGILIGANKVGTPTILARKDIFDDIGGFDENIPTKEDWDLALKIAYNNYKMSYIGESLIDVYPSVYGVNDANGYRRAQAELLVLEKYWASFEDKSIFNSIILRIQESLIEMSKDEQKIIIEKYHSITGDMLEYSVVASILIPIYNARQYLEECIESTLKIKEYNIEVICINDGSKDDSLRIIEQYAAKDSRIRILDKVNSGYGDSLNKGIEMANGRYISILESDDTLVDGSLEKMLTIALKKDVEVVKGNYNLYDSTAETITFYDNLKGHIYDEKQEFDEWLFFIAPSIWSGIYKKSFLQNNTIEFLATPGAAYQDTSFAFKIWACAKSFVLIENPIVNYRVDTEDSSSNIKNNFFAICAEFYEIKRFNNEKELYYLNPIYMKVKYISYLWNINRLTKKDKILFLYRMHYEMEEECFQGILIKKYWADQEWIDINRMIFCFDSYLETIVRDDSIENVRNQENIRAIEKLRDMDIYTSADGTNQKDIEAFMRDHGIDISAKITMRHYVDAEDDETVIPLEKASRDGLIVLGTLDADRKIFCQKLHENNMFNYIEI